jgi:hypothetical protein
VAKTPRLLGRGLAKKGEFKMEMKSRKRVRFVGIILGMFVLASFMTGLLGMALSEKNREYFVYRLKNIRQLPLFKPTKLPEKNNE